MIGNCDPKFAATGILAIVLGAGLIIIAQDYLGFGLIGTAVTLAIGLPLIVFGIAISLKRRLDAKEQTTSKK